MPSRKIVGCRTVIPPPSADLDHEETAVEGVAVAVLDRGGENIEQGRLVALEVEEDRPAAQMVGDTLQNVVANHLEERMPGRDPFQGRVGREGVPCRRRSWRTRAPGGRTGLPAIARSGSGCAAPCRPGRRGMPLASRPWAEIPRPGAAWTKKCSTTSGTSRRSLGLGGLADDRREVQLLLGQSFQGRFGDRPEPLGADVANDPGLDVGGRWSCGRTCRGTASPAG